MFVTYDYECPRCGDKSERFINKKEKDAQACYKCGNFIKPLMPAPATTFKFNDK